MAVTSASRCLYDWPLTDGPPVNGATEFARLLRSFRVSKGLSQEELAERAGLSRRGVSDLERGARRAPYAHTVQKLADALGMGDAERGRFVSASRQRMVPEAPTGISEQALGQPVALTSLIGREEALAALSELLKANRLTTMIGPGGIGKTRLAQGVAALAATWQSDGVRVVELAAVSSPLMVSNALAAALGLRDEPGAPLLQTLIRALRTRHMLLVFDNCEHLVEACAALVTSILQGTTAVRILATSREPLGIPGEWLYPVLPLAVPTAASLAARELANVPSVQLFTERARAAGTSFTLTASNAQAVVDICCRMDGIPLALELAAARMRILTVEQIAERLGDSLGLLSNPDRSAAPRHQTLRAAIGWSFTLLSDGEQQLFARLSVFAGGWTIEAAEVVCSVSADAHSPEAHADVAPADVLDLLARLIDRSLVVAEPSLHGTMRYRMLEPLRQYAAERLLEAGEVALLRDAHLEWFVTVAEQAEREMWSAGQVKCLDRLYLDRDNVHAALTWSTTRGDPEAGLRIAAALPRFWDFRGSLRQATEWLAALLALPGAQGRTPIRAKALTAYGYCLTMWDRRTDAVAALQESLELYKAFGQPAWLAAPTFFRGFAVTWIDQDPDAAEPWLRESLELSQQYGPVWVTCCALFGLGDVARLRGNLPLAERLLAECIGMAGRMGDRWVGSYARLGLGMLLLQKADRPAAREHLEQALRLTLELGDKRCTTYALECLAHLALAEGRADHAARLFGAAQGMREPVGDVIMATLRVDRDRFVAATRARIGDAAFEQAVSVGRRMTPDETISEAYAVSTSCTVR